MGLSRILFYSLFIFISGLDDITDDRVRKLADDLEGRIAIQIDLGSLHCCSAQDEIHCEG